MTILETDSDRFLGGLEREGYSEGLRISFDIFSVDNW